MMAISPPASPPPPPLAVAAQQKTAAWLNALSDGLSWIEVQGNQVVASAASGGEQLLASTSRTAGKRPLSFSGLAAGLGRRASAEPSQQHQHQHQQPPSAAEVPLPRSRPASFRDLGSGGGGGGRTFGEPSQQQARRPRTLSTSVSTPPPTSLDRPPPAPANLARLAAASGGGGGIPPSRSSSLNDANDVLRRTHRASASSSQVPSPSATPQPPQASTMMPRSASTSTNQSLAAVAMRRGSSAQTQHTQTASSSIVRAYRPGFQPQGVRRSRTEEYEAARRAKVDELGREEGRLGRRWAKLVDLHFNPKQAAASASGGGGAKPVVKAEGLTEVWRGLRSVSGVGVEQVAEERKREAEMAIVRWENDREVRRCRICQSAFSLTNRKHHCRLCGRIVCSLPASPPELISSISTPLAPGLRRQRCSSMLVADWKTQRGSEVDDDFRGWLQIEGGGEVQVKGVRACRECWSIVSRKQKMQERRRLGGFARAYDTLKLIEREIADALPELREMTLDGQQVSADTLALHKHLVVLFQQYDTAAKRIRAFPAEAGSAQERLQQAIAVSAATFVAKEGAALQVLPRLQRQRQAASAAKAMTAAEPPTPPAFASRLGLEDQVALQLQPLLEQEAQIEEYLKDAQEQRKFDDAKTLKASLEEIREEIARLAQV